MSHDCNCSVAFPHKGVGWSICVIVVFPDHTHLLFFDKQFTSVLINLHSFHVFYSLKRFYSFTWRLYSFCEIEWFINMADDDL